MLRRLTILLLPGLVLSLSSGAQLYPFVNYTPRDGLVGNKVRFINQDSKGKLYFGTSSGLSIYDGARFTNYSTANGLYTNLVNGISEQGDDSVLVILNGGRLQCIRNVDCDLSIGISQYMIYYIQDQFSINPKLLMLK
mgnify:CR=1 FL=1